MPIIDQKFWFNGLPISGLSPAGQKFWFNGLPTPGLAGTQILAPSLYSDDEAFHAPVVEGGPAGDEVLPSVFIDTDAFHSHAATSTVTLAPTLYEDSDAFYEPALVPADVLTPGHVIDDDALHAPGVQPGEVTGAPSTYDDSDILYAPLASSVYHLLPSALPSDDDFHSPVVITARSVFPDLYVEQDAIVPASLMVQIVLVPPFLVSETQIYTPVDASTYFAFAESYSDAEAFYAPIITTGSVGVSPSLVVEADVMYTPAVQRQSTQGGGGGGNPGNTGNNIKYATKVTMDTSGLITELQMVSSTTKSNVNARMMIYADSVGAPGALLTQSASRTGVVSGTNTYDLLVSLSVLAGQNIWVALHTDGNVNWLLSNSTAGSRYNTDLFSDGPSDPFGTSSIDNKKAPVIVVLLESANDDMQPPTYDDADVFFSPLISKSYTMTSASVIGEDFFYSPVVLGKSYLSVELLASDDEFYSTTASPGSVILQPPLLSDEGEAIIPVIGVGDGNTFPPHMVDADSFGESTVTREGAGLPPTLVTDDDSFHAPSIVSTYTLAPSLVPSDDATQDAGAAPGAVTVRPSRITDVDQHWVSNLSRQGGDTYLTPDCVVDTDAVYPPTPQTPRRAHRATLRGVSVTGVTLGATAKNESIIEGDRRAAQVQLEGNDA